MLRSIVAVTLRNYNKQMTSQVFNSSPGWYWISSKGRQDPVEGGTSIEERIEIADNSTIGWRAPKATIPLDEQDPFRSMIFPWKHLNGAVVVYQDDERMNRGQVAQRKYSKDLVTNCEKTMKKKLGSAFYSDGTDPNMLWGLELIVSASNTYGTMILDESNTVAMDRSNANFAWWRSQVLSTAEPYVIQGGTDGGLRRLYNNCTQGEQDEAPDLILTTQAIFEKHVAMLLPQQRFTNEKMAEAGFQNIMFDGATIAYDRNCPTGNTYCLNSTYLNSRPDSLCADRFIIDDWHPIENVSAHRQLVEWVGNLVCKSPRHQGKLTNKT